MGSRSIQRWGFVLLLVVTFSFSISIIISAVLTEPTRPSSKRQSSLPMVDISGHRAILLSPHIQDIHARLFDPSFVREMSGVDPKIVAFQAEKLQRAAGITRYAVSTIDRDAESEGIPPSTVSLPVAFLLFASASVLLGIKAKKFLKTRRIQSLEAFAHDLDEHDLVFDITYTKASKGVDYGSFVSTQPGDFEKFDI